LNAKEITWFGYKDNTFNFEKVDTDKLTFSGHIDGNGTAA
jgi:hypothetical protein